MLPKTFLKVSIFLISLSIFLSCTKKVSGRKPVDASETISFIFPHIHAEKPWEITELTSLWRFFIFENIAEPLIRINSKSEFVPALAKEWTFSPDGTEIIFKISDSYYFHDNKSITPDDVYKSLQRVFSLKKTAHSNFEEILCDELPIKLIKNEIHICLKKYLNGIMFNLATPEYGIVPSKYQESHSIENLSGPYKVKSLKSDSIELEAFEKHPLIKKESIRKVRIKEITDFNNSIEFYKRNNNTVLIGTDYNSASKLIGLKGTLYTSAPSLTEFFIPNTASAYFKNISNRKAFAGLVQSLKKELKIDKRFAEIAKGLFTPSSLASFESIPNFPSTSKVNKKLKVLLFDWMEGAPLLLQMQKLLKTQNVDLEIILTKASELKNVLTRNDYDLIYIYSGVSALDPIAELVYLSQHPLTKKNFEVSGVTKKIDILKYEKNRTNYAKLIKEIHQHLLEEVALIPIAHTKMVYLASDKVKLIDLNYFDGSFNIWDWTYESQ